MVQNEDVAGENADEMNVSKLEYHLQEYPQLLEKALTAEKGQKALVKKLLNDQVELVDKCSINELRRAAYNEVFITVPEGRKLVVSFMSKIGVRNFWLLSKNLIQRSETSRKTCEHFGEIYLLAWKNAVSDEYRREIELIFEDVVRFAITAKSEKISDNFRSALDPLLAARNKQTDVMIEKVFRPNLWRCLKSVNSIARYNACKLFFLFYPVVQGDDLEDGELPGVQLVTLSDLISDSCASIRAHSCKEALRIFGIFWSFFSNEYRKTNFGKIVEKLSRDKSFEVRLAVYEGMKYMVPCAEAVNAVERAVKRFILWGINDKVVKVRVAAFKLLGKFKNHRYIKWWNVVELQHVLERLEVEKYDSVKELIAGLLVTRVFNPNASGDEILKKITFMGNISRMAVIKFHESISKHQLITIEQAVEHLIAMGTTVYKLARSHSRHHEQSTTAFNVTDFTVSSIESTPPLIVDASKEDDREGARLWRQFSLLLECVAVTWAVLRKPLSSEKYVSKMRKVSRLFIKLFGYLLHCFKSSSIAETILVFGSTLRDDNELNQISNSIQKELLCIQKPDSQLLPGYVEALANWDLERVITIINEGLNKFHIDFRNFRSQKKLKAKAQPDSYISRCLLILKTMLQSPTIQQDLAQNFDGFLYKFYVELKIINSVIDLKVSDGLESLERDVISLENVVRALEIRQTLAIILLNTTKSDEEKDRIFSEIYSDIEWFISILPNLTNVEDESLISFLENVCQTMVRLIGIHLQSYSYPNQFLCTASRLLEMLCNHRAPHCFIVPVLRTLRNLFLTLVSNHGDVLLRLIKETVAPLTTTSLIWMTERCNDEGFNVKGCAETFLSLLTALQNHGFFSGELLDDLAKTPFVLLVASLKDTNNENLDVRDPRGHDFEVDILMDLLVHRILFKNYLYLRETLKSFRNVLDTDLFLEGLEGAEIMYMFGAQIQFLYLCDVTTGNTVSGSSVKPCSLSTAEQTELQALIKESFEKIKKRLAELQDIFNADYLYGQISTLCS